MEKITLKEYEIERFLNLNASYNGKLGTLQENTKNSLNILRNLLEIGLLNNEQGEKYSKLILDYFKIQIEKVLQSPLYYIN